MRILEAKGKGGPIFGRDMCTEMITDMYIWPLYIWYIWYTRSYMGIENNYIIYVHIHNAHINYMYIYDGYSSQKIFNLGFSVVLFRICRTVFFSPLIMRPSSNPFILKLFSFSDLDHVLVNDMQTPPPQQWPNWVFGPKRCAMFWNVCKTICRSF